MIMMKKIRIYNYLAKKDSRVKCMVKALEIEVLLKRDKGRIDYFFN